MSGETPEENPPLRYGWTTGACAAAAAKSAFSAWLGQGFPDPVMIMLPKAREASFSLHHQAEGDHWFEASVIKDAGDDPDVTHGAEIKVKLMAGEKGQGLQFKAGEGVGMVTKPGLPVPPGEPAINPAPRAMIEANLLSLLEDGAALPDMTVEISIPGGEALAEKTWNGRLGILGGLSVLGTSGIVVPYSCAAWIHSIHRGIDVARATGDQHLGAAVGNRSEAMVMQAYGLAETSMLDMGNFVGGMLKYLRRHPVPFLTIAGGFGKMVKLAEGAVDLHSSRSQVNRELLAEWLSELGAPGAEVEAAKSANTALEILQNAGELAPKLVEHAAKAALAAARGQLGTGAPKLEILIADRAGKCLGGAREVGFTEKKSITALT